MQLKTPLSTTLFPAVTTSVTSDGKTLIATFDKALIDNNMPAGDAVPLIADRELHERRRAEAADVDGAVGHQVIISDSPADWSGINEMSLTVSKVSPQRLGRRCGDVSVVRGGREGLPDSCPSLPPRRRFSFLLAWRGDP